LLVACGCGLLILAGCHPLFNGPLGWTIFGKTEKEVAEKPLTSILVGERAVPTFLQPIVVEAVGLVTGLRGTGSDPPPSPQREALISEMQKRGVDSPHQILASPNTALVLVRGYIRPGMQIGDPFDIEVRIPSRSETTSLRGGWLMETRLSEHMTLGGAMRSGHLMALAKGPILVDPSADPQKNPLGVTRGRVLGGGRVLKSRSLALVVRPEYKSVRTSAAIASAINTRFHRFENGLKTGTANAKTDEYIELVVHPSYRNNIPRYLKVIRSIAITETTSQRNQRLAELESQLAHAENAEKAALQLEGIGKEGQEILKKGLNAKNAEVRFHSAESLAYQGQGIAAKTLGDIARDESAMRVFALTSLSVLDEGYEVLRDLLDVPSAETRYGAFRALWTMNAQDPLVKGETLSDQVHYHVLDSLGPPLVHATRSFRPEIVVFGSDQRLITPLLLDAGPRIHVHSKGGEEVTVARFAIGEPDEERIVSAKLDSVLRAVVELGGTYPDLVQMLQAASDQHLLEGRFAIDALPEAGRTFRRELDEAEENIDAPSLLDDLGSAAPAGSADAKKTDEESLGNEEMSIDEEVEATIRKLESEQKSPAGTSRKSRGEDEESKGEESARESSSPERIARETKGRAEREETDDESAADAVPQKSFWNRLLPFGR